FYRSQQGFVGHVLGGWEVSGIISAYSGRPFTVFDSSEDTAGIGVLGASGATQRPDLVGDPYRAGPVAANPTCAAPSQVHTFLHFFNPCAFAHVPPTQIRVGNAPRGAVVGPGLQRWDISLFKNTKINERLSAQFRAEAFNVFNHTNFDTIRASLTS